MDFAESGRGFVAGQVIVRFRSSTTSARREQAIGALGAAVVQRLPLPHTELLHLGPGRGVRDAVATLKDRNSVVYAQPNFIRHAATTPNDPSFSSLWGLDNTGQSVNGDDGTADADIDAPEAWNSETGDVSTVVAVVDTGVDYTHTDLVDNIWSNPGETPANGIDDDGNGKVDDVQGWDFVNADNSPLDEYGHGTHVAGTIGAQGNNGIGTTGVAWDVSLMPVRVLDANGSGTDAGVAAGFVYAAHSGADVVNASLGGPGDSPVLNDAVASNPGTLYVVAAGNDGSNNDYSAQFPCNISASNLICVAASDQNDQLAWFSNYGTSNVDLAAPGTNIYSTYPGGALTPVFSDDFESSIVGRWATGGTNNTWERTTEASGSGSYSLTDSPYADYLPNTSSWASSPAISLAGKSGCQLDYELLLDAENGYDALYVEGSTDGSNFSYLDGWTGYGSVHGTADLSAYNGASTLYVRFRLVSDGSVQYDGAYLDDVQVGCPDDSSGTYDYLQGTSMATPHVSGAAALLFSAKPSASVAEVRSALLGSVDAKPSFSGKVASGGRLNVNAALQMLSPPVPETTISSGPSGLTNDNTPTFGFSTDQAGASFECAIDSGSFAPCTSSSSHTTGPLSDGSHTFYVRASTSAGTDLTPAWRGFTVDATAPNTMIASGPSGFTNDSTPTFAFRSTEAGSSFQCKVDSRAWGACSSPRTTALTQGVHTFYVQAKDTAANVDPTPARRGFRVDSRVPSSRAKAPASVRRSPIAVTYTASDPAPSSGLATVELWALRPGQKRYAKVATDTTPNATRSFAYKATAGAGTYRFYTRVKDKAGNYEKAPTTADATTVFGP